MDPQEPAQDDVVTSPRRAAGSEDDTPEAAAKAEATEDSAELSARDREVLALAGRGWTSVGAKERAIRETLDLSPPRFYQILNHLLDEPRAWRHDPATVKRLRKQREEHRRLRGE